VATIRLLRSAPITEAVFDFRVKVANDFHVEDLASLKQMLSGQFPKVEEQRGGQVTIGFKPGPPEVLSSKDFGLQGYFFKTDDEKLIAQFRVDGFTLNRLAPYTSWDELYPLASELWKQYCGVATPQTVTRLALRYINHIPLPWPNGHFDEYLRAGPNVPPELPQTLAGFQSQVVIHNDKEDIFANVVQRYEASFEEQKSTVVLDIDAFKTVDLAPYDANIPIIFGQLRNFKNTVFFNYLTDEAVRRFE